MRPGAGKGCRHRENIAAMGWILGSRARRGLFVVVLLVLGLAGCQTLDQQQRRWIFQPSDRSWGSSATAADGLQDVWIDFESRETGGPARLHGLWLPAARGDAPRCCCTCTVHAGTCAAAPGACAACTNWASRCWASTTAASAAARRSSQSEAMAYEDARAAWGWLGAQHPQSRRFVFGHSLGGAIAVHLASEVDDAAGLMVEGSFTSIPDVFSSLKWGWLPVGPLITQRFDAAERIARTRAPVLVVHGSDDRLIPPALGRALYDRAPRTQALPCWSKAAPTTTRTGWRRTSTVRRWATCSGWASGADAGPGLSGGLTPGPPPGRETDTSPVRHLDGDARHTGRQRATPPVPRSWACCIRPVAP